MYGTGIYLGDRKSRYAIMETIDITELDPSNFNWLRESKKLKEQPIQEEVEAEEENANTK